MSAAHAHFKEQFRRGIEPQPPKIAHGEALSRDTIGKLRIKNVELRKTALNAREIALLIRKKRAYKDGISASLSLAVWLGKDYKFCMTDKQAVVDALERLPEGASLEEITEELRIMAAIRRGRSDLAAGQSKTHEEVEKMCKAWLNSNQSENRQTENTFTLAPRR